MSVTTQIIFPFMSDARAPAMDVHMTPQNTGMARSFWLILSALLIEDDGRYSQTTSGGYTLTIRLIRYTLYRTVTLKRESPGGGTPTWASRHPHTGLSRRPALSLSLIRAPDRFPLAGWLHASGLTGAQPRVCAHHRGHAGLPPYVGQSLSAPCCSPKSIQASRGPSSMARPGTRIGTTSAPSARGKASSPLEGKSAMLALLGT